MIFDPAEYTRYKGTPEDITYRKATEEESFGYEYAQAVKTYKKEYLLRDC